MVRFVNGVSLSRTALYDEVTTRIADATVAALLIAKASLAAERGVGSTSSRVALGKVYGRCPATSPRWSATWSTTPSTPPPGRQSARVEVGRPGGPPGHRDGARLRRGHRLRDIGKMFRQGCTTKTSSAEAGRGFGLALTRLVCLRRGGDITVANDDGAVFTARLGKRVQA